MKTLAEHRLYPDGMKPDEDDAHYMHHLKCWVVELRELVTGESMDEAVTKARAKLDAYRDIHDEMEKENRK